MGNIGAIYKFKYTLETIPHISTFGFITTLINFHLRSVVKIQYLDIVLGCLGTNWVYLGHLPHYTKKYIALLCNMWG